MKRPPRFEGWVLAGLVLAGAWGAYQLGFRPETFTQLFEAGPTLARYAQPDFEEMPRLLGLIFETVVMGFWGTAVAFFISIPLTGWAARNLSPFFGTFRLSRELFNFFRAMPDALLALILIQGFGLGPLAGALALGIHSSGFLGKVLAENMERVPLGVYEGLRACGASRLQVVRFGAWPSVEREVIGNTLYLLDRNIRVATTLGIVGAGGIGGELLASIRRFDEPRAATVMLLILILILSVDSLSAVLRKRLQ